MKEHAKHIPRIDILRAVAILLVFSSHFYIAAFGNHGYEWVGNWFHDTDDPSLASKILRLTLINGALGVSLFFVVSGLCIRLSHRASESFSTGHFYWRRFWRIYPPYLTALCLFVVIQGVPPNADFWTHAFLVHNFSINFFESINGPFWSLALEFQVYLMYPALLLLHNKLGVKMTGGILFALSAGSKLLGGEFFRSFFHLPNTFAIAHQLPFALWFTWYAGFLLADAWLEQRKPGCLARIGLVLTFLLFPLCKYYRPMVLFYDPVSGALLALLTWEFLSPEFSGVSIAPPLGRLAVLLGSCSYSFYLYFDKLIHPCLRLIESFWTFPSAQVRFLVGYPITLLVISLISFLIYRTVELGWISIGRQLYSRWNKRQFAI